MALLTARYLTRRLIYLGITFFIAVSINFFLPRLIPGNPVYTILISRYGNQIKPQYIHLIESQLNLTGTLWQQYIGYWDSLLHGYLGVSFYYYPSTVVSLIATSLPWTLFLLGTATILSVFVGVSIATYIGWRLGGKADSLISSIAIGLGSLPFFWLGLIFQIVFGLLITINGVHLFPIAHAFSASIYPGFTSSFIISVLYHSFLPIITLVLISFPGFTLLMRNTISTIINDDYVQMARAKGLRTWRIKKMYVNRNARLPIATSVALAFGSIVGGAFLVEVVFSYPGIGYVLYNAVTTSDFPLIDGIFLIITITVIIANLIVDLLYAILDPRVVLD